MAGDLNAEIGRGRAGWENQRGHFGSGLLNDNGARLLNFASDHHLKIANIASSTTNSPTHLRGTQGQEMPKKPWTIF